MPFIDPFEVGQSWDSQGLKFPGDLLIYSFRVQTKTTDPPVFKAKRLQKCIVIFFILISNVSSFLPVCDWCYEIFWHFEIVDEKEGGEEDLMIVFYCQLTKLFSDLLCEVYHIDLTDVYHQIAHISNYLIVFWRISSFYLQDIIVDVPEDVSWHVFCDDHCRLRNIEDYIDDL